MRSHVFQLVLLTGLVMLPLQARAQAILQQRCNIDSLSPFQAKLRLDWMRRCALLVNVRNPAAGYDIGFPSINGSGNLIDYAEDYTSTNWVGTNRYIGSSDEFEINNSYITKLYLSGGTSQVIDSNGYRQWTRAVTRRKQRPLYPTYGSQYDIASASNFQLFPHPNTALNDCRLFLDRNGTQPATGYNFYVNGFCEASPALGSGTPAGSITDVAGGTWVYSLTVPAGATNLVFETSGATGDVDLAVRLNATPTSTQYDCRPFRASGNERCVISNPSAGTWYASLNGFTSYSGVSLKGEWNVLLRGLPMSNLAGAQGSEQRWTMQVPAGLPSLTFTLAPQPDSAGDADLYVQFGSAPTSSSFGCRPYIGGNSEVCTFSNPAPGTWHVMLRGYGSYSGAMLTGSY
jgi:hypothetical protein